MTSCYSDGVISPSKTIKIWKPAKYFKKLWHLLSKFLKIFHQDIYFPASLQNIQIVSCLTFVNSNGSAHSIVSINGLKNIKVLKSTITWCFSQKKNQEYLSFHHKSNFVRHSNVITWHTRENEEIFSSSDSC